MRSVHCVACASLSHWDERRERYTCTSCRLSFDSSAAGGAFEDVPDLSEHLETSSLSDLVDPDDLSEPTDLSAPAWSFGEDVPGERRAPSLDDELVVWRLDLEADDEATTDGRIG